MEVTVDRVTSVSIRQSAHASGDFAQWGDRATPPDNDKGGESLSALPALLSACVG